MNYSYQIIRLWRELHSVANLNPSLHPSKLRLCARYRLPLRWHILTLNCNGDALALSLVMLCAVASAGACAVESAALA